MQTGLCSKGVSVSVAAIFAFAVIGAVGTEAHADEVCPNEALRQELNSGKLPDCRAYELVSPVFKSGTSFNSNEGAASISGDGSHIIDVAFGAFAHAKSNPYENTAYELTRMSTGWDVSALNPPGSMSPESGFFDASKDLARTLWGLHRASQSIYEEDLYVRESDGHFIEIGPMVPKSYSGGPPSGTTTTFGRASLIHTTYTSGGGASADLSHVLITVQGANGALGIGDRWPGDATVAAPQVDSLYEYAGTGLTRPALVGVNNNAEQISQCGTDLGAAPPGTPLQGDKYNAVSANGNTVFFTARARGCKGLNQQGVNVEGKGEGGEGPAVDELYARVDGVETVRISEPLPSQCEIFPKCQTGHSAVTTTEKRAEFQGASEDGSKAFFVTDQELFKGQTTTNLYEYDFNNPARNKVVLVSTGSPTPNVQGVARISEDGSHVYFVAQGVLTGANGEGKSPVEGADNLYAFERDGVYPAGRTAFVATLCSGMETSGTVPDAECLSEASDQQDWSIEDFRPVQATPNGRFLVFASVGDLTPDDTSTVSQIFEYDAQEEKLVRVSVGQCEPPAIVTCAPNEPHYNSDGNTTTNAASIVSPTFLRSDSPTASESTLSISNDGSYVFFNSADELTNTAETAANAGASSVYAYHSVESIANGNIHLISDGKDITRKHNNVGAELLATDALGTDVFFATGDPLLAADVNTGQDIYDARIDGGFAEPSVQAGCQGESCQGTLSSSSALLASPGSASAVAGGNSTASVGANSPLPSGPKSGTATSNRTKKLAGELRACRKKSKKKRTRCEALARKKHGAKSKTSAARTK